MSSMIDPADSAQKSRNRAGIPSTTLDAHGFDRQRELADFLRRSRARVTPEEAGLPALAGHRRTPGLRREELAALSGISVDWYIRLEQGRAERPSPSVLDSLAAALRLSEDERAHLYALARAERPLLAHTPSEEIDPSMERILRSIDPDTAAYVLGWRWDVLAWNRGACELLVDFDELATGHRNLIELTFLNPTTRERYADWEHVARLTLANFRAAVGRNLERPETKMLVDHLCDVAPHFAEWWGLHEIEEKTAGTKLFHAADGSEFEMRFESVLSPSVEDQRLLIYTPAS